uniref:Gustatory receptor n=1 Tax=Panagrolaimus sp. JU765 TaxID=591449 RepID=A0AC34R2T1_9BILA
MALLGFHIVVTLIALTLFSKLKSRFSFCHALVVKGLHYFAPPSTYELREIAGRKFPEKKRRKNIDENEPFNIPKDSEFRILRILMQPNHLDGVPFYENLCFIFDYLVFTLSVFSISETFLYFFPENKDTNVSIVWLFLATAFLIHVLVKLTASNFASADVADERNLIVSFCAVSFLFCTVFTIWCDKFLDIGFENGFHSFTKIVAEFLREQEFYALSDYGTKSPILAYVTFSVMFSALSSMLLFPSLRYSTMYIQATHDVGKLTQFFLHITFLMPVVILSMFTKPVRNQFVNEKYPYITDYRYELTRIILIFVWAFFRFFLHITFLMPVVILSMFTKPVRNQFVSEKYPYITDYRYELTRIILIFVWASFRLVFAKPHLQAFLNTAEKKIIALRKESGYIKSDQLQKMIIRYAQYFCAAALQYFIPVFLTLILTLLLKKSGYIKSDQLQKMVIRYAQYFCAAALQYFIPVFLTLILTLLLKSLGNIDAMAVQEVAEMEDSISSSAADLKILLNFTAQKALWSYCVVMMLMINSTLSVFGTVYSYNFVLSS